VQVLALLWLAVCCSASEPEGSAPAEPQTAWVEIAGKRFELELALDSAARYRGLSGRQGLADDGGMLFVFPDVRPVTMVMRDCSEPLDLVYLDAGGRVLAVYEMVVEPPRRADESLAEYERRLAWYASGAPARFAIEMAGGQLRQLGLGTGQRVILEARELAARAR